MSLTLMSSRHHRMLPSYRLQTSFLFVVACLAAALHGQQNLVVDSPTLKAGAMMPRDYTPDGRNVSPPLTWTNVPAGTRGFAVVCEELLEAIKGHVSGNAEPKRSGLRDVERA